MKHRKQSLPEFLDHCFSRFRELPQSQIESACERVLQVLHEEGTSAPVPMQASRHFRYRWTWRRLAVGGALAAVLLAVLITAMQSRREFDPVTGAVVQTADGPLNTLSEGEILRTNDGVGAVLSFVDASSVEVRDQSELSLERVDDGIRIRLNRGSVIVNAAEHRTGRLYVRTKDLTVAVVGTVFLVTAEQGGSRVAVIQGEVRVQHGMTELNLTQGDEMATNPLMQSIVVSEEIAWSRNAEIHLGQLQQSRKTIEERCGPTDFRSIVHDNGGWNWRLPRVLWRKYKCQHEGDGQ